MNCQYRGLAYVVGVNAYTQANKLSNAVYDAQSIATELKTLGFYVMESYDIDFMGFINEFDSFKKELNKFNVGLFYFAGHGVEFEGKNWLTRKTLCLTKDHRQSIEKEVKIYNPS